MAELLVVRHGQAAFGADNYDQLSDLGRRQSAALARHLKTTGWEPDRVITGTLERQKATLQEMGFPARPETHAGFNEYDFHDLLYKSFGGRPPDDVMGDRKTHFRTLKQTVLAWQRDEVPAPSESFAAFTSRVADALRFAIDTDARRVLVVSSGGVIGQIVASVLAAPPPMMMELNLQIRNTSATRFVFSKGRVMLAEFNTAPHFDAEQSLVSYS